MPDDLCPKCGSSVTTVFNVPKPHYAMRECIGPDHHFLGWVKDEEWTLERAQSWVMPFGKNKGKCMQDIDRHYLEWIVANFEPNKPAHRGRTGADSAAATQERHQAPAEPIELSGRGAILLTRTQTGPNP